MPLQAPNFPLRGAICGSERQFREEEQDLAVRGVGTAASELESSARLAPGGRAWPGRRNDRLARPRSAADDPLPTSMRSDLSPESRQASYQAGSFCPHSQTLKRTVFAVRSCWWAT